MSEVENKQRINNRDNNQTRLITNICQEVPSHANPFLAEKRYIKGYSLDELITLAKPVDLLFLLYFDEIPADDSSRRLLEVLMIYLSVPSPRETASRASMVSGISKANPEHLLPIALMSAGGGRSGAKEVGECHQFISEHLKEDPQVVANQQIQKWDHENQSSHVPSHLSPGFGQLYGNVDPIAERIFQNLLHIMPSGRSLQWVNQYAQYLNQRQVGLLEVGISACVFQQLGFHYRDSIGLYQLLKAPGLLAYGMEQTHNPLSTMPMLEDENYALNT